MSRGSLSFLWLKDLLVAKQLPMIVQSGWCNRIVPVKRMTNLSRDLVNVFWFPLAPCGELKAATCALCIGQLF